MEKQMINKITRGTLGKLGTQINQRVNQWDWELMKSMVKSRGTVKLEKRELNRGRLGI